MDMERDNAIWLAGYVTGVGSLFIRGGKVYFRLKTSAAKSIDRVGDIVGKAPNVGTSNGKPAYSLLITGDQLHELMTQLWPWLGLGRKMEYAQLRRSLR